MDAVLVINFCNDPSTSGLGHDLTYANDRYLAADLASDAGSTEFKFLSAPRAPKHPRPQSQGT